MLASKHFMRALRILLIFWTSPVVAVMTEPNLALRCYNVGRSWGDGPGQMWGDVQPRGRLPQHMSREEIRGRITGIIFFLLYSLMPLGII